MSEHSFSILVPIRVNDFNILHGFSKCYNQLAKSCAPIEIVVVDDSGEDVFNRLDQEFDDPNILHFRPEKPCHKGDNCKLHSIEAALKKTKGELIALFDDDARPTAQNISAILEAFQKVDIIRCMVYYQNPSFFDCIDLAGIYIINVVSPLKQFWGNLCFRRELLKESFFNHKSVLFDELAIEYHCRQSSQRFMYISSPAIPMVTFNRSWNQFWEQRIRFAYENIVFIFRFLLFLSILPALIVVSYVASFVYTDILFLIISMIVTLLTFMGQLRYGKYHKKTIWLYGILWFWFYPVTSWIALMLWLSGGKKFRDHKIRRAI